MAFQSEQKYDETDAFLEAFVIKKPKPKAKKLANGNN